MILLKMLIEFYKLFDNIINNKINHLQRIINLENKRILLFPLQTLHIHIKLY